VPECNIKVACITNVLTPWSRGLLTPWSRGLLEELTGSQLVKKFPAFYGTQRFITAFTRARHLSLY
jgi:N-acetyl-gamma-glutamylphosphate reductase